MKQKAPVHVRQSTHSYFLTAGAMVLLFAIYFATARFGLSLHAVSRFATLVWLPSGLSIAALLLFGPRLWPGILLGAFLVNLLNGAPLLVAFGIGVGNTLEALVGSSLLKRYAVSHAFDHLRDVLLLVLLVMPTSAFISATVGVSSLLLGHVIAFPAYFLTWSAWWVGDMISILIVTPLLLVWSSGPGEKVSGKRLVELGILAALVVAVGLFAFLGVLHPDQRSYPLTYLVFPPFIWAALRFGPRGALCAVLTVCVIAIVGTIQGLSPFSTGGPEEGLVFLQSFMGICAVTSLLLAAVMAERKELERRKDEFISLASHELRTPLTSLQVYTELLRRQMEDLGHPQALHSLVRMAVQIERLSRLIADFLGLSRIQAGQLTFAEEVVEVDVLVGEVVESLQQGSPQHQISIQGYTQRSVIGDRQRLEQVLANLLGNAMKYSPNAQRVSVHLSCAPGTLTVSVQDFGVGIPKAQQEKIFEPYYRVSAKRARTAPGLGLGLYLAQQIVKHHGGRLWVESAEGQGSIFSFSLPTRKQSQEPLVWSASEGSREG